MQDKLPIIVTGSTSGIGRAISRRLLDEGYTVIGIARNTQGNSLEHARYTHVSIDLAELATLPEKLKVLAVEYPDIQGIVFCAGRGQFGSLEEFSFQQIQSLVDLNFTSQAFLARSFVPNMKKHGSGSLIFIGSEAALKGGRKGAVYCASKFAIRGFIQALRDECSKNHVRVTMINPGMVNSAFYDELYFEPGNAPENFLIPEDVAQAVSYVLATRPEYNVDEINLSPLKNVVQHKKPK